MQKFIALTIFGFWEQNENTAMAISRAASQSLGIISNLALALHMLNAASSEFMWQTQYFIKLLQTT